MTPEEADVAAARALKQPWTCERCTHRGVVTLPAQTGVHDAAWRILDAHRLASPACDGGVWSIRTPSEEPRDG